MTKVGLAERMQNYITNKFMDILEEESIYSPYMISQVIAYFVKYNSWNKNNIEELIKMLEEQKEIED